MLYITGDECGLIKEFNTASIKSHRKNQESSPYGIAAQSANQNGISTNTSIRSAAVQCISPLDEMSRQHGIVRIVSLSSNDHHPKETEFAALRINGTIQLWRYRAPDEDATINSKKNEYHNVATIPNVFKAVLKNENNAFDSRQQQCGHPFSMGLLRPSSTAENDKESNLVVCSTSGTVVIVDPKIYWDPVEKNYPDRGTSTSFSMVDPLQNDGPSNASRNCIVSAFCTHSINHWIALGGKDRDIAVYDAQNPLLGPIWKAKNLPPHPQTLLQPQIWPTAACFMNDLNTSVSDMNHSNLLAVGTAYRQTRIYDLRMSQSVGTLQQPPNLQRRPIVHTDEKQSIVDYRITAICPMSNHSFLIGDGGGTIISYDLRQLSNFSASRGVEYETRDTHSSNSAVTGRFVGPAGSVKQLTTLPGQNHFACVGYDRMLRVYDISSRKQLHMIYLKQRLNCVLMLPSGREDDDDNEDFPNDSTGYNDIEQEDKVQDYSDSENESTENEDDIVAEMIDALDEDDDGANVESDESDDDEEGSKELQRKRKRQ